MNTQKTLEKLHGIAEMLPKEEKAAFDFCRKHPGEARRVIDSLGVRVYLLIAEAEEETRREAAKATGNGNRQKAAERVIKSAKAFPRDFLHGAWTDAAGRQCICDGFQAYRLREALPLEPIPEKTEPLDLSRIISSNEGEKLALPDVSDLRAYIKTEKARKKAEKDKTAPLYDFGNGLPAVNAAYLLNVLELLPGCTATASKMRPLLDGIYFESEAGDGLILPVRKAATV